MGKVLEKALLSFLILLLAVSVTSTVFAGASAGANRDTSWVPDAGSYMVGNSLVEFHSDSGYNDQGPNTIVDGFNLMQSGQPDFVWYGEYEYISTDGGTTWNMLPSVRTLTEIAAGQEYLISFDASGTPLEGLTIDKRVTIVTGPDKPVARIEYSITPKMPIASLLLYYAIDYCDAETTGDATDDVYVLAGTEVLTAQWINDINSLYVDTLGSGFGIIKTDYLADYYAGSWFDALYQTWVTGYDIHHADDGIGVKIDLGAIAAGETVHKSLYIGIFTAEAPPVGVHDVAVTAVTPLPTEVAPGDLVSIAVTVENQGDLTETFDVTVYYDNTPAAPTQTVTGMDPGAPSTTLKFSWDTAGVAVGTYTVKAVADTVPGETDIADNTFIDGEVTITAIPVHDIAITSVTVSPTTVTVGEAVSIDVTVVNEGNIGETFDVSVYYDSILIETQTGVTLSAGDTTTLTFTWDTTGVAEGTYTIKAEVPPVPEEVDLVDNVFIDGEVTITPIAVRELIATGWGRMCAEGKYVLGPAELYMIGDAEIELVITFKGVEYSRMWRIINQYMKDGWVVVKCIDPDGYPLTIKANIATGYVKAYGPCVRFYGKLVPVTNS